MFSSLFNRISREHIELSTSHGIDEIDLCYIDMVVPVILLKHDHFSQSISLNEHMIELILSKVL